MLLVGVKEENGWLLSRWHLTYRVSWEQLLKGISAMYEYYKQPEVLVDGRPVSVKEKGDISKITENMNITLRSVSDIIKVPIMITFYNQLADVDVNVAGMTEEFKTADYEKFNKSLSQYMDSIELAMHR